MALNKGALASAIMSILDGMECDGTSQRDYFANSLADAIDTFVRSGDVEGNTSSGTCTYAGSHPTVQVVGKIV